ncbi:MAG: hypothetical protein NVSMB25_07610 [Thermoleophilaceae bacterium]
MTSAPVAVHVLREASASAPDRLLLWRGSVHGSDVDVLALPGARENLQRVLRKNGLSPNEEAHGRTEWLGCDLPIDVLSWDSWPDWYPSLAGMSARSHPVGDGLRAASAEDICLVLAVEAVLGRPAERLVARLRAALEQTDPESLRRVATDEGARTLSAIAKHPEVLLRLNVRGRLPYAWSALIAVSCPRARPAIRHRLRQRLGIAQGRRAAQGRGLGQGRRAGQGRGVGQRRRVGQGRRAAQRRRAGQAKLLIALSGMDGSGKSTAAGVVSDALMSSGFDAEVSWWRLAEEVALLDRIASPVKRTLGWAGTVADVTAAGGPRRGSQAEPAPPPTPLRLVVGWVWTIILAVLSARSFRAKAAAAPAGAALVLDRWRTDALVDLEVRYGRHRVARALLGILVPRPDSGIWLRLDPETAASRKPGDQDPGVLERMAPLYARIAASERLIPVDASAALERVHADLREIVAARVMKASGRH